MSALREAESSKIPIKMYRLSELIASIEERGPAFAAAATMGAVLVLTLCASYFFERLPAWAAGPASYAASFAAVYLALLVFDSATAPANRKASRGERLRISFTLDEAFKRSNDVMFYCDKDAIIQDVNDAFVRTYGFSREEAVGQNPRILRSPHSPPELYGRMWKKILDPEVGYWRGEVINKAKDGREIPLVLTITSVRDDTGTIIGYVSNGLDLTELTAMQQRVAQAEALAGLGEMAAVMAHEIRNPLGSIVMAAKQLGSENLGEEDRGTVLQVLRSESKRLNEVLTNFLAYARPREIKLERADLNAIAGEVCAMIEGNQDLSRLVRYHVSLDPRLKPFPFDPNLIRQVLWNIMLNAIQAMDGRGDLSVSTRHEKGWARLSVRDSGPGIEPESLEAIFKPFHTTKKQGTGLGLAIADRIVKAQGGRIEVESRAGEGACFTVLLPWTET